MRTLRVVTKVLNGRVLNRKVLNKRVLTLGVSLLLLAGCNSGGRHFGTLEESLSIQVLPNTSKLFVYSLTAPESQRRNLVQVYRSTGEASEHRRREPEGERSYRYLRNNAARALKLTGYCREGFMELDYRMSRDDLWLRGECREGATEEDIQRFGDRDELPVPEPSK